MRLYGWMYKCPYFSKPHIAPLLSKTPGSWNGRSDTFFEFSMLIRNCVFYFGGKNFLYVYPTDFSFITCFNSTKNKRYSYTLLYIPAISTIR